MCDSIGIHEFYTILKTISLATEVNIADEHESTYNFKMVGYEIESDTYFIEIDPWILIREWAWGGDMR